MTDEDDLSGMEEELARKLDALTEETAAAPAAAAAAPRKHVRLPDRDWRELVILWESGNYTLADLEKRYGMKAASIQARLKANGIEKGSKATATRSHAGDGVEQRLKNLRPDRVIKTKEEHYSYAEAMAKLTMEVLITAKSKNARFGSVLHDITALGRAAKTLEAIRKERFAILDIQPEGAEQDEPAEFLVSELTASEIETIRAEIEQGLDEDDDFVMPPADDVVSEDPETA